ncbi:MAG: FecR family protein [Elusimicrobiota bacterium]
MKISKKFILFSVVIVLGVTAAVFADTATVSAIDGTVQYVKKGADDWQPAEIGTVLAVGDKIGCKDDSSAELSFENGHKAKLGSNSFMVIESMGDTTAINLFKGKILSKVRKLSRNENYTVKTPQSVCAVRGTEFAVNIGETTQVIVYEGSVAATELETGAAVIIPAGKYTIIIRSQPPSEPDDIENLDQTGTGDGQDTAEGEGEEEAEKDELRQEMRDAVQEIAVEIDNARDVVENQKETDSSTGRTLRDVHGNLVRIEQYLLRPEPDTVQFINITKRNNYIYKGKMKVGSTGPRLDTIDFKAKFNMNMPEKISDWLGFFEDIDDQDLDFHPETIRIKLSNKIAKANKDEVIISSEWEENANDPDREGDMGDMNIIFKSETKGEWNVFAGEAEDFDAGDQRLLIKTGEEPSNGMMWNSEDAVNMWVISPKLLLYKDLNNNGAWDEAEATIDNTLWVRMGSESWAINNDGNILDTDMFENGDMNPFEIVKNIAFESSILVRYSDEMEDPGCILSQDYDDELWTDSQKADYQLEALQAFNSANNLFATNLDLVITPDFVIPIMEEIAKGASKKM